MCKLYPNDDKMAFLQFHRNGGDFQSNLNYLYQNAGISLLYVSVILLSIISRDL